jgi:hypothetical protein
MLPAGAVVDAAIVRWFSPNLAKLSAACAEPESRAGIGARIVPFWGSPGGNPVARPAKPLI